MFDELSLYPFDFHVCLGLLRRGGTALADASWDPHLGKETLAYAPVEVKLFLAFLCRSIASLLMASLSEPDN